MACPTMMVRFMNAASGSGDGGRKVLRPYSPTILFTIQESRIAI